LNHRGLLRGYGGEISGNVFMPWPLVAECTIITTSISCSSRLFEMLSSPHLRLCSCRLLSFPDFGIFVAYSGCNRNSATRDREDMGDGGHVSDVVNGDLGGGACESQIPVF
jgi:hypothetical protein